MTLMIERRYASGDPEESPVEKHMPIPMRLQGVEYLDIVEFLHGEP